MLTCLTMMIVRILKFKKSWRRPLFWKNEKRQFDWL